MKLRMLILSLALCIPMAAQQQAPDPKPTAEQGLLKGVVTDPQGAVYAHAIVRIIRWEISRYDQTWHEMPLVYTDSHGRYSVALQSGEYDVLVLTPYFTPAAKRVKVVAGKESRYNAKLKEDPFAQHLY